MQTTQSIVDAYKEKMEALQTAFYAKNRIIAPMEFNASVVTNLSNVQAGFEYYVRFDSKKIGVEVDQNDPLLNEEEKAVIGYVLLSHFLATGNWARKFKVFFPLGLRHLAQYQPETLHHQLCTVKVGNDVLYQAKLKSLLEDALQNPKMPNSDD